MRRTGFVLPIGASVGDIILEDATQYVKYKIDEAFGLTVLAYDINDDPVPSLDGTITPDFDWGAVPWNSRYYPMDEGTGKTLFAYTDETKDTAIFANDAEIINFIDDSDWKPVTRGGISAEVQLVFDRMVALTPVEQDAIEIFVDGMVSEGLWGNVFEFYAPCLNASSFLIGFKTDTLLQSASPPIHTAGQYLDFTTNAMHVLEGRNFDTYSTPDMFFGVYNVFTDADVNSNSDLFGLTDGSAEVLMRWRGNIQNDFNELVGNTITGGRSAANQRPTGDFVGLGRSDTTILNLQPGAVVDLATVAFVAMPSGFPMQWHGQMQSGTPAGGNVQNARYSCMMSMAAPSIADSGKVRNLVLGFLINIGVTGVPLP